jgi:heat-inducible transcriptional repressor
MSGKIGASWSVWYRNGESEMEPLTERQEQILSLIVREYVHTPAPVSSKGLVAKYPLGVSSATVRNDMVVLEEHGYIYQPHTSAGRVPTEAGYRYFVQKLIGDDAMLPAAEQLTIRRQFKAAKLDLPQWMRLAASVLAQSARSAALVTSPQAHHVRFKYLELIGTQGRLVLMVLVLEGGDVRQQMLTLAESVSQERLSEVAQRINAQATGLETGRLRQLARHGTTLEREIIDLTCDLMDRADRRQSVVYHDGLANILDPRHLLDYLEVTDEQEREGLLRALEEADSLGARQTLHLLEEQSLLEEILADALTPAPFDVHVMIAGEGRWEALSHCSMVISRYGIEGQATGALGVLGPTRLHYGRAISAVRYVAGLLSELLIEIYGAGDAAAI